MNIYDMIRDSLPSTVPFTKHVGVTLTSVDCGKASASLEMSSQTTNHMGTPHAGALFTLGETAAGGAVAGAFAPFMMGLSAFPRDVAIQFLKPARGEIRAIAELDANVDDLHAVLKEEGSVEFNATVSLLSDAEETVGKIQSLWKVNNRSIKLQS